MLTNCVAACAHLTITVCEIQGDICEKNRNYFVPPLHSTPFLYATPHVQLYTSVHGFDITTLRQCSLLKKYNLVLAKV